MNVDTLHREQLKEIQRRINREVEEELRKEYERRQNLTISFAVGCLLGLVTFILIQYLGRIFT